MSKIPEQIEADMRKRFEEFFQAAVDEELELTTEEREEREWEATDAAIDAELDGLAA
jgi:hypothetical protein